MGSPSSAASPRKIQNEFKPDYGTIIVYRHAGGLWHPT